MQRVQMQRVQMQRVQMQQVQMQRVQMQRVQMQRISLLLAKAMNLVAFGYSNESHCFGLEQRVSFHLAKYNESQCLG